MDSFVIVYVAIPFIFIIGTLLIFEEWRPQNKWMILILLGLTEICLVLIGCVMIYVSKNFNDITLQMQRIDPDFATNFYNYDKKLDNTSRAIFLTAGIIFFFTIIKFITSN